MGWIVDLFASGGMGALVGMLGSWMTKREDRKNLELTIKRDVQLGELRLKELAAESEHELAMADKEVERAEVEGDIAIESAEIGAFAESLQAQAKSTGIVFVDAIRGLMRPLITVFLLILATWLAASVNDMVGGLESMPKAELFDLYRLIIQQLIFLTVTAVTWWFGSRPGKASRG